MISIKNFKKIDTYFIRNLRINSGDPGEKLASALKVSKTYLYSVEKGNNNPSDEFMHSVLTYYGVAYDQSVELYEQAYNLVIKMYECVIFKNNELFAKCEKEFKEKEAIFAFSRAFIFNDLIKYMIELMKYKRVSDEIISNSSKYLPLYDNNVAYICGVTYVFGKGISYNLADSKKVLFDIYDRYPIHNVNPSIKGMFYYQLGRISSEERSYLKSLNYYHEAIEMLKSIYCVERVNQTNIEIANILLGLKLYDEAKKKYLELLEEARKHNFKRRMNVCLSNLSYLCLLQKKYDECEKYIMLAKEAGSNYHDLNYYLAYCAYKTKTKDKARSIISKLINEEEDRYASRMMKMIQGFVNDNESKIDNYFALIKKDLFKLGDKLEIDMLYEMVISYYVKKNTDKCAKLVEEYLNLPKN
ncbi:MAG: hypothetical protein MR210_09775 [Erysipelotrichaceae bacterium]|nr:hypothetical protein [Erysipelotrichaceae bacterium]MDY5252581.1 hypothetical protein [Erysipelotrichaceae bacterium]